MEVERMPGCPFPQVPNPASTLLLWCLPPSSCRLYLTPSHSSTPQTSFPTIYPAAHPPSIGIATPVTSAASSLARNTATFATSSGSPSSPQGVSEIIFALVSGEVYMHFVMGVLRSVGWDGVRYGGMGRGEGWSRGRRGERRRMDGWREVGYWGRG